VGRDRVKRIWGREGLKVPKKHKPRGRLWLNDGSRIRLWPERAHHVWSFDFVESRTHDGRSLRIMTLIDEHTRECLQPTELVDLRAAAGANMTAAALACSGQLTERRCSQRIASALPGAPVAPLRGMGAKE
jgi:transposase InsO family protein